MSDEAQMRWRTGRKVGRTVYARPWNGTDDSDDVLIGMFDTPELARVAVDAHNEMLR